MKQRKAYIVVYELHGSLEQRKKFAEVLKSYPAWWHYIKNAWIIVSEFGPNEVFERLRPHMNAKNDYVLIMEVRNFSQGWLPQKAWEWINKYVPLY